MNKTTGKKQTKTTGGGSKVGLITIKHQNLQKTRPWEANRNRNRNRNRFRFRNLRT